MDSLKALFLYLDKENIIIDKDEFEFQFNSHPDYPSLLALSDTLRFFNIDNGAFNIGKSEIDLLPNSFIARLKNNQSDYLAFVQKKENTFVYTNGTDRKHHTPRHAFENLWDNVVLLVENDANDVSKSKFNNWLNLLVPLLSVLIFILVLTINSTNAWFLSFSIFPVVGVFLSIAVLNDLFNTKSKLLDKFCNATSDSSCNTVVNSSKWKIFDTISFSDLSILFFTTQICALFLMGISENLFSYFYLQTLLLLLSVPIIAVSIYYQKYIEKKWCPICMTIMGVLLLELGYVLYLNSFADLSVTLYGALLFLFVASIMAAIWFPLKKILAKVNDLKTVQLKANRFKRNYTMFKNMLISSEYYDLPKSIIEFGNANANIRISIVTSPYCSFCREPHYMLKSIYEKHGKQIHFSVMYNINPTDTSLKDFVKGISFLTMHQGIQKYYEAMGFWYQSKNNKKWLEKYGSNEDNESIQNILDKQSRWFVEQDIYFTPCLFVNGYRYPKEYDIADLPFFVDELIDDTSFYIENKKWKIGEAENL